MVRRIPVTLLLFSALAALPSPAGATLSPTSRTLAGSSHSAAARTASVAARRLQLAQRIAKADARRVYWLRLMHRLVPRPKPAPLGRLTLAELERAAEWRVEQAETLEAVAHRPPHLAGWRCIQRFETGSSPSAWHTNTGNGYYGGLQFDLGFQTSYGGWLYRVKGTANHWTALEQMWTAELAHAQGRGYSPWPSTARACGLL